MKTKIYCKTQDKGIHTFYLNQDGEVYCLFSQNYRKGVSKYYGCPVSLDAAIDCSRAKRDSAILRTMEKITASIRYLEKQYNIAIYKKSIRKTRPIGDKRACA